MYIPFCRRIRGSSWLISLVGSVPGKDELKTYCSSICVIIINAYIGRKGDIDGVAEGASTTLNISRPAGGGSDSSFLNNTDTSPREKSHLHCPVSY